MSGILRILDDLCFPWPVLCRVCGKPALERHLLCEKCLDVHRSNVPILDFAAAPGIDASAAAHVYTKQAAVMVRTMKFQAVRSLSREMAEDMIAAAHFGGFTIPDKVAFVPMHWTRSRARFYNHSRVLAGIIAKDFGAEVMTSLVRVKYCRQQSLLRDDEKRRKNVANAFRVKDDLAGQKILLIDDVYTTGATAGECALALKRAGAEKVLLLTYATAHNSHK